MLEEIIHSNSMINGGVTLMAAGWAGYQIRALPGQLLGFVRQWTTRVIEIRDRNPLYDAWLAMLTEAAVRRGGPRTLEVRASAGAFEGDAEVTAFSAGSDSFWAFIAGRWCRVRVGKEEPDGRNRATDLTRRSVITVEVVRGTRRDLEVMLAMATRRADIMERRQLVELCDKWGSRHTMVLPKRDPATLCFPREFFERMLRRLAAFRVSQAAFESVGIPWRFGVLLYGSPGTGKTSLAHALASELGIAMSVISLADMRSDEELVGAFTGARPGSMVLLEDVDAAFGAKRASETGGITFAGLLNCIDGMLAPHNGRILVMSTNHIERLDPALIRPGRIDLRVEMPLLTREAAADYLDRVFPHVPTRHQIIDEIMLHERPTAADLINRVMLEPWQRPARAPSTTPPVSSVVIDATVEPIKPNNGAL